MVPVQWRSERGADGADRTRRQLARGGKRAILKKLCENADCKFHMCLRMRAIKQNHYSQRVPIAGYKFGSLAACCSTLLVLCQFRVGAGR